MIKLILLLFYSFIKYVKNCMYSLFKDVPRNRTVFWKVLLAVVKLWHFSVELWHGKSSIVVSL